MTNQHDRWDRTISFNCLTCIYYVPKGDDYKTGRCRRHAPTMSGYPVVYASSDWCGDHKIGTNPSKDAYYNKHLTKTDSTSFWKK